MQAEDVIAPPLNRQSLAMTSDGETVNSGKHGDQCTTVQGSYFKGGFPIHHHLDQRPNVVQLTPVFLGCGTKVPLHVDWDHHSMAGEVAIARRLTVGKKGTVESGSWHLLRLPQYCELHRLPWPEFGSSPIPAWSCRCPVLA